MAMARRFGARRPSCDDPTSRPSITGDMPRDGALPRAHWPAASAGIGRGASGIASASDRLVCSGMAGPSIAPGLARMRRSSSLTPKAAVKRRALAMAAPEFNCTCENTRARADAGGAGP